MNKLVQAYVKFTQIAENWLFPLLILIMRIWIARIFWLSGLTKISNWGATLFLFKDEYKVPFIPHDIAAYLSTFSELAFPVLLVIGLATRFAVLPLIVMALAIHFTYDMKMEHFYWWFLMCTLLFYGAGKFSLDYLWKKKYFNKM